MYHGQMSNDDMNTASCTGKKIWSQLSILGYQELWFGNDRRNL